MEAKVSYICIPLAQDAGFYSGYSAKETYSEIW